MTSIRPVQPIMPERTTWLVQRFEPGKGYVNPYGDMNQQIGSEIAQNLISDLVTPDYMGAAEYEWGAYPKCLAKMYEQELILEKYDGFKVPIYIISANMAMSKEAIHKIYDETEVVVEQFGRLHYNEVSKADYGSFKSVVDRPKHSIKPKNYYVENTIGWMSLEGYYAWFIGKDIAETFKKLLTPDEWKEIEVALEKE